MVVRRFSIVPICSEKHFIVFFGLYIAGLRRSLGRYSSLADSDHGVFFFFFIAGLLMRLV
jgi:hypothetical protein